MDERVGFAALLGGLRPAWLSRPEAVDVWDAKGLAEGMTQRLLRREATLRPAGPDERPKHLHPRGAAWIEVDGKRVGALGPVHPDVVEAFDLGRRRGVRGARPPGASRRQDRVRCVLPLSRASPPARATWRWSWATALRRATSSARCVRWRAISAEQVSLFDRFVGGNVPAGHASLALRVVYRASDRTLTDAEVDQRHAQVVAEVEKRFGAQLRA